MPCHPRCPGFGIFNAPDASTPIGGNVQRCDECRSMTDAQARTLVRAMGATVDRHGTVLAFENRTLHLLALLGLA